MNQTFKTDLISLFSELTTANSPLVNHLQKGVSRDYINKKINGLSIAFRENVFELYGWRNGIANNVFEEMTTGQISLFSLGVFMSLETAVEDYINWSSAGYWNKDLFPLFTSGGGDFFLINASADSSDFGKINFYSPSNPEFVGTIGYFDSLATWVQTVLECYRKRIYFIDSANMLDSDFHRELEIFIKYNPNSEYWRTIQPH